MNTALKIGELARRTVCPVETIRYYERAGLLPAPARSQGNYRLYGETHVERLCFIRRCRSLDMALDEIRMLLRFHDAPTEDCAGVNDVLDAHIGHVSKRIDDLRQLDKQLRRLRRQCGVSGHARDCRILNELSHAYSGESCGETGSGHIQGAHSPGPRSD